jgi:hypothetical protein
MPELSVPPVSHGDPVNRSPNMGDSVVSARDAHSARHRDAVRVLQILAHAGKPVAGKAAQAEGIVSIVRAEKKLQALDFWMRYPDYLAHELLEMYEDDKVGNSRLLDEAISVLGGAEPELRRLGMLRNWFGAYGALDDALAMLVYLGLVKYDREIKKDGVGVKERTYYLLKAGAELAAELSVVDPLSWYAERAKLVAFVARGESGNKLKNRQHAIATYHNARHGEIIESIREPVQTRLDDIRKRTGR